jgi:hypothetical protein
VLAVLVAFYVLVTGCDNTFIAVSSDGRILVVISSSGSGIDDDGFTILVDGSATGFQVVGGSVTLTGLSQGQHSVRLSGLADNCVVVGANPVTAVVGADGTARVSFTVHCDRATTGALSITVTTLGEPADTDGYLLAVGEGGVRNIANNATEKFVGLPPGTHLVLLKNLLQGCVLDGGNPQSALVVVGETRAMALVVRCGGGMR